MEPDNNNDAPPAEEPGATSRLPARRWVVGAVLGVLAVVLLLPMALTVAPQECASCHEMRPYFDSWQTSSHRAAAPSCLTCHVKPGILNYVAFDFGLYRMLASHLSGVQVKTTAANTPSVESCRRSDCHSLNREVSNSGDIKINHRLHVTTANIACPACHSGAVHDGVGGRTKLPPMKLCKECHADKMTQCNYCHTQQHLQAQPGTH
jgi:hypothetical protein